MKDFETLRKMSFRSGPIDINLYATDKCNFKCWFCRRQNGAIGTYNMDLRPKVVESALKAFPSIKTACIAGFGEPLLNNALTQIIQTLNDHNIAPSIITNGSLLEENLERLTGIKLSFISVSLNESNAEKHEAAHKVKMFDKVLGGIRAAVANGAFPVGVSKVVYKQNYKDIPAFLDLAASLKVNFVNFVSILPHLDDKRFWEAVITQEDLEIVSEIDSYKELPFAKRVEIWPTFISKNKDLCPRTCTSPWACVGINGHGHITPCRRILGPVQAFGYLDGNIWDGAIYRQMREGVLGEGRYASLCEKCFGNWKLGG